MPKKLLVFTKTVTFYIWANYSVSRIFAKTEYCRFPIFWISIPCKSVFGALRRFFYLDKIKIRKNFSLFVYKDSSLLLVFSTEDRKVHIAFWMTL